MPTTLACVNLKGGVGKTAIAVNFAAYCGTQRGLSTLLIDLDPQTNATFSCISVDDWEDHAAEHGTVADLLGVRSHTSAEGKKKTVADVLMEEVFSNVDLIPSHLDLFTVDLDLASATARETRLKKALATIDRKYDLIVCDCPPNLTLPTQNALAISSHYVVPISPDYLSALGVGILLNRIDTLSDELDADLEHAGIVISRVGRAAFHRAQTVSAIRKQFKGVVLKSELHERVAVSEAAQAQACLYDRNTLAAREFSAMSEELLKRIGFES